MAKVDILKVGHALVQGERGEKGGAPSKDSIWGIAFVHGNLVKFFGRRGGTLRFKAHKKAELASVMAMFEDKLTGKGKDYHYTEVAPEAYGDLIENMSSVVGKSYDAAVEAQRINTRAMVKVPKIETVVKAKAKPKATPKATPKAKKQKEVDPVAVEPVDSSKDQEPA